MAIEHVGPGAVSNSYGLRTTDNSNSFPLNVKYGEVYAGDTGQNVKGLSASQVATVASLVNAGTLTIFRPSVVPLMVATPTPLLNINAGAGNSILGMRVTINPDTDTIGAQRLLGTSDAVQVIPSLDKMLIIESSVNITKMHLVGISNSVVYTGAAYVIGSAETDLADAIANDARLEFANGDNVRMVTVTLSTSGTGTAHCQVVGYSYT